MESEREDNDADIKALKNCIISRKEYEKRAFPQRSTMKDAAFLLVYGLLAFAAMAVVYSVLT